jgi:ornithine cyclodeaminase/alanine dehydrogenase-like protein (mu-crystallin family)
VLFTVTPARSPIVQLRWLGKGATVVAVGSDGPYKQELTMGVLDAQDAATAGVLWSLLGEDLG